MDKKIVENPANILGIRKRYLTNQLIGVMAKKKRLELVALIAEALTPDQLQDLINKLNQPVVPLTEEAQQLAITGLIDRVNDVSAANKLMLTALPVPYKDNLTDEERGELSMGLITVMVEVFG